MTSFWILWGIDALAALIVLYFFFVGLADGSVSSYNSGIWTLLLCAVAVVLLGSLWLQSNGHLGWAKTLLWILAVPTLLYGLFILVVLLSGPRWN